MGRKQTPSNVREIKGNPGKRKINKTEPKPKDGVPTCPSLLCDVAKREWKRLSSKLGDLGLLTEVDRAPFMAYCHSYAMYAKAVKEINAKGLMVKGYRGPKVKNPAISIANKHVEIMIKLASEFGMTPASRTKISIPEKPNQSVMASLLG